MRARLIAVLLAGVSLPALAHAQAPARIGVASAVRNEVTAQGSEQRPLSVGSAIYQNELIRTGPGSVAQLLFADQTTLSVGPSSELRLDRFVYNPDRSAGDVAVSLTTGALRFISGSQNPRSYQVTTPVATMGVRGTIVDILLIEGRVFGILDEGQAFFTLQDGREVMLDEPGTAIEFFANGAASEPMTWRGRYEAGLRVASFPLYGNPFADTPQFEGASTLDHETNRTDEINARVEPPAVIPPPPP
ncbi:MAG TPA: FecR domain-containing protein, partial [Vitreimonas sp.]|nr:FecR domain-containing protein [Vitreimonas sp.]